MFSLWNQRSQWLLRDTIDIPLGVCIFFNFHTWKPIMHASGYFRMMFSSISAGTYSNVLGILLNLSKHTSSSFMMYLFISSFSNQLRKLVIGSRFCVMLASGNQCRQNQRRQQIYLDFLSPKGLLVIQFRRDQRQGSASLCLHFWWWYRSGDRCIISCRNNEPMASTQSVHISHRNSTTMLDWVNIIFQHAHKLTSPQTRNCGILIQAR